MRLAHTSPDERFEVEKTTTGAGLSVPSFESSAPVTPGAIARWVRFLTGLLVIVVFVFVVLPAVQRVGPVRDVHDAIERSGIDATAIFYSEIDESSEAESSIRNALKFPAHLGEE